MGSAVVASRSFALIGDQTSVAQHLEMLRHRRLSNIDEVGELSDGVGPAAKALEDHSPCRIGEGDEDVSIGHALYRHTPIDMSTMPHARKGRGELDQHAGRPRATNGMARRQFL